MECQEYGFFDSEISGYDEEGFPILDRAQSNDIFALFFSKLVSNGVMASPANCFMVEAYEGMTINIDPGYILINGHFGYNVTAIQFTLDAAPSQYNRIVSVIGRLNNETRLVEIILKYGAIAANPVAPEILQPASGDYYELCLAEIYISANQTVITQSSITDTRYDTAKCGIVTQLIDSIDTSLLYAQLTAFYDEYVERMGLSYQEYVDRMAAFFANLQSDGLTELAAVKQVLVTFEQQSEDEFNEWFETIKDTLSSDIAGMLELQIQDIIASITALTARVTETEIRIDGKPGTTVMSKDAQGRDLITTTNDDETQEVTTISKDGNTIIKQWINVAGEVTKTVTTIIDGNTIRRS